MISLRSPLPYRTILCLLFALAAAASAQAATYKPGFTWFWELDYSVYDSTPNDAASVNCTTNTALSEGPPSEDVWGFVNIHDPVKGGFPGGDSEPKELFAVYGTYLKTQGYGWLPPAPMQSPALGRDVGPEFAFVPRGSGWGFLKPMKCNPPRPTVALRWTAPTSGAFDIRAEFSLPPTRRSCSNADGVNVYVIKNTQQLEPPRHVLRGRPAEFALDALRLSQGTRLYFAVNALANAYCDETALNLTIRLAAPGTDADIEQ